MGSAENAPVHPEYNAVVSSIRRLHPDLMIMRTEPDEGPPRYRPGQFTTIGLFTDEQRIDRVRAANDNRARMVVRAYSISCPILNADGELTAGEDEPFLEFYIALVRRGTDNPPALTPRLFALEPGHRLFVSPRPKGRYSLSAVEPRHDVIFVATGTGEAPHNTMIRELLTTGHRGRIASFVCVRQKQDLGYAEVHTTLESRFPRYRYIPLTTREPENIDPEHPLFAGKWYLQDVFSSPRILNDWIGWTPDPGNTHVFLCGNPAMIGAPRRDTDNSLHYPDPKGMIESLVDLGFQVGDVSGGGTVHFERYW